MTTDVTQLRTCDTCGGFYLETPEEARQAHLTVMGHPAIPRTERQTA